MTPARYQSDALRGEGGEGRRLQIQLVPPGLERLSRLDSEDKLQERIRQETIDDNPNERAQFPEEPILSRDSYHGRGPLWEQRQVTVEPNYVCHFRLLFEQTNMERGGWDLGIVSPLVGTARFAADLALLPYHLGTRPGEMVETSAGRCLPGDPVPLLLYPPEISVTGLAAEAVAITALLIIFP